MAYEGGYTSAVNSGVERRVREQAMQESVQRMALQQWIQQTEMQDRQRRERARSNAGSALATLYGGDAPAPEGMQPIPAPPPMSEADWKPGGGGPIEGISPSMMQAFMPQAPSGPMAAFMPQPPGAQPPPPGQASQPAPQPPQGGPPPGPPPGGMPPPGAGMAPPQGAGAPGGMQSPPGPPQGPQGPGFQPRPGGPLAPPGGGAPGGAQMQPPPAPQPPSPSPAGGGGGAGGRMQQAIAMLSKQGVPPDEIVDTLTAMMPAIQQQDRETIEAYRREQAALKAGLDAYKAALAGVESERKLRDTQSKIDTREDRLTQRERELDMRERNIYGQGKYRQGGGAGGSAAGASGSSNAAAAPKDDVEQGALDIATWRYIQTGTLPYRKGTGGGKDRNDAILRNAAKLAKDMGMSPEELVAQPADFKAQAQSLAFQTKKLDAIQGTLRSFHNNVNTWDKLAKGLPPDVGGEHLASMAQDLEKINFTGIKSLDDIKLKIQQQFNDPTVSAYLVAAMAVATDYARIMQGPQSIASLTEGARADAQRLISAGANDKARQAIIGTLESDTQGQVKGIEDQLTAIRGRMGLKSKGAAAAKGGDDMKAKVEAAGVKYEPEKYDYRINEKGEVQRKAKA